MISGASILRKTRLMIGLGLVKLVDDAKQIQKMQLTIFKGEVRDGVNRYGNYGFTFNPKKGAEAVLAMIGGNRSHLVALCVDDGRYRPQNLSEGEVKVYHFEGGYIYFKNGKEIHVSMADGKVFVDAPEVTVTATTKVTLDTPTVECKHDLKVDGKLDVTGDATLSAKLSVSSDSTFGAKIDASGAITGATVKDAAGKILGTHVHTSATPGSPTSPPT